MKTKLFTLVVALIGATQLFASDFHVDGICYNKLGGDSVEVTYYSSYGPGYTYTGRWYSGELTIPSTVIYSEVTYRVVGIGARTFESSALTSITIPNSVTTIGDKAFYQCSSLKYARLGNNVTTLGYRAFYDCTQLASINIHPTINSVGEEAFYNCTSLTFNIHDNAKYLGNPKNKYHLLVQASSTSIDSCDIHETTTIIADAAFRNCTKLDSIFIPLGTTHIGKSAFSGCSKLQEAIIPNTVVLIDANAFEGCKALPIVDLPESVINIETEAFKGCLAFTEVTIPQNVTNIGDKAFTDCTNIENVIMKTTTPPTLGLDAFHSNILITVPCGTQETYEQSNTRWNEYFYYQEEMLYTLSVVTSNKQQGIAKITQEPTCNNATAVIEAIPYEDYVFEAWNDGNTDNPRTITVTADIEYTATFKAKSIQTTIIDTNTGSISGIKKILENGTIYILRNNEKYTIDGRKIN